MIHSPFHIVEDFVSPLRAQTFLKQLALREPNRNKADEPLKFERVVTPDMAGDVLSALEDLGPALEARYGAQVWGEPSLTFQQFPENPKVPALPHTAEGWIYHRKNWVKNRDIDLVGFIWLKTFHNSVPLDPSFETYGGKIEFPAMNFSLTPVQGTLVLFPATPHFVHAISHVMVGSMEQIKVHVKLRKDGVQWQYNPANFPGNFQQWFTQD